MFDPLAFVFHNDSMQASWPHLLVKAKISVPTFWVSQPHSTENGTPMPMELDRVPSKPRFHRADTGAPVAPVGAAPGL